MKVGDTVVVVKMPPWGNGLCAVGSVGRVVRVIPEDESGAPSSALGIADTLVAVDGTVYWFSRREQLRVLSP